MKLKKIKVFILFLLLSITLPNSVFIPSNVFATVQMSRISVQAGTPSVFRLPNNDTPIMAGYNYTRVKSITWMTRDYELEIDKNETWDSHGALLVNNFDINEISNAIARMKSDYFNVIRVFINNEGQGTSEANTYYGIAGPRTTGQNHWNGLYIPYMDNVIDFLQECNAYQVYVVFVLPYIPDNDYYITKNGQYQYGLPKPKDGNGEYLIDNVNLLYMDQLFIDAKCDYIKNFMQYIKDADPDLLSTILAIDFQNEVNVVTNEPPFTRSDHVQTADGLYYDMSINSERQQCVDANIVNWANQCMEALNDVDPYALGTASVFCFNQVGLAGGPNGVHQTGPEYRYPARPTTLAAYSMLSFIEMHVYPLQGTISAVNDELNSSEHANIDTSSKPLMLGEFGAYTWIYSDSDEAGSFMQDMKNYCRDYKDFRGWMYWTYDCDEQPGFYNGMQDSGTVNSYLAPLMVVSNK